MVWPLLVKAAKIRETISYGSLAHVIGVIPLSVNNSLGPIQDYCLESKIPPLTAVVFNKGSGRPGRGYIERGFATHEDALNDVYGFSWEKISNPFSIFGNDVTPEKLAEQLVATLTAQLTFTG